MDGENNGKPYEQMDGFGGVFPIIFGNTQVPSLIFKHLEEVLQGGPKNQL